MPDRAARLLVVLGVLAALVAGAVGLSIGAAPLPAPRPTAAPTTASPSPSPTPSPTPTPAPPLEGVHILLDPGHNGGNAAAPAEINRQVDDGRGVLKACNTVGTSTLSGYPEHAFTWDVATRARDLLEEQGATVSLTREDDEGVGPCVDARGRSVGELDADALVSIHADGSENPAVQGYFAIVSDPPLNEAQGEASRDLAAELLDALDTGGFTRSTIVPDALSERSDLGTLNWAERPAVMLELAEMRNPEEAALVESPEGRQRYAEAIAAGLVDWAEGQSD